MTGRRRHLSPEGSPPSDDESGAMMGNSIENSTKEQDRFLPIANVSRIMKKSLPANAKISKEAKETVQECVSEFISFVTGEASDKCQREKRKTINGDDLLWAMTTLGFENYVGPLKIYLQKYRETEGEKNSMARQGDQSPAEDRNSANHHGSSNGIGTGSNGSSASVSSFNGGFHPLMAPMVHHGSGGGGGGGGRALNYGENQKMGSFHVHKITENGNGNRATATHHGLGWTCHRGS